MAAVEQPEKPTLTFNRNSSVKARRSVADIYNKAYKNSVKQNFSTVNTGRMLLRRFGTAVGRDASDCPRRIEAARRAMTVQLASKGKIWIVYSPDKTTSLKSRWQCIWVR